LTLSPPTARYRAFRLSAQALSLDGFDIERHSGGVAISSSDIAKEPDLRYVIYSAFSCESSSDMQTEEAAKAFTTAMTSRPPQGKTVALEFRKPADPTLSFILVSHTAYMSTKPADYIGVAHADRLYGTYLSLSVIPGLNFSRLKPEDYDSPGEEDWYERWTTRMATARVVNSAAPQTLGYAFNDSPLGLASWIIERRRL